MALIMVAFGVALPLCLTTFAAKNHPAPPPPPTITPTKAALSTISVLFIGVDSLMAPQPVLESLTVVAYTTEIPKFMLWTLSPDTATGPVSTTAPAPAIRSCYADDARLPRQAWVTQTCLRRIWPPLGAIYAEVDFDRQTISETIGLLAPFDCMGQTQTGEELLRRFDALAPAAAEERLHFQADLLKCLFVAAQKQNWSFSKLTVSLGRRFYPTRDLAIVTSEAAPSLAQSEFDVNNAPLDPFITPAPPPKP